MARNTTPSPRPTPAAPSGVLIVKVNELARILGVDQRTIQREANEGHLVKLGRDQYDMLGSITAYCTHLRAVASQHDTGDKDLNPMKEGALLKRATRLQKEVETQRMANELIPVGEIVEVMSDHIKGIRMMVQAFPAKAQAAMPHLIAEDIETLRGIARELLLANSTREIEDTKMPPEISERIRREAGEDI